MVYEGAEGQAISPGGCEVGDDDTSVALRLLLTPAQQPSGMHVRLCKIELRPKDVFFTFGKVQIPQSARRNAYLRTSKYL